MIRAPLAALLPLAAASVAFTAAPKGVLLENLTWIEAEKVLTPASVVVVPLGAASKEHGPHLLLKNDQILAEYLKRELLARADVVVAPTVTYSFYPAFVEYPGSVSLRLETARDLVVDICRSLARFGPRRFYVLNTGVSTVRALKPAAETLAAEGILLRFTELDRVLGPVEKEIAKQEGGTHADEIETSMILFMDPASVDMKKAVKDYRPGKGPLTRTPPAAAALEEGRPTAIYSPSGVWGDATLATREKGERATKALLDGIARDVDELRRAPLPAAAAASGGR